jgi:hypothetical protein
MMNYPSIGMLVANILLPRARIDVQKWAVIACDQFTSEPEYWASVARNVGTAPSTFHMILPEAYLGTAEEDARAESIRRTMSIYLEKGILEPHQGLIWVERSVAGRTRHGLMLALDLERYDYHRGSQTLIRATEGTILDRLPPRIRIRSGAPLELPHILVLIDDPEFSVIEPLTERQDRLSPLYDFELMLDSGHVKGGLVQDRSMESQVVVALEHLADPSLFQTRYGSGSNRGPLLFAVGDGNHSLATAKAIWEQLKPTVGMEHPARYALVELENLHEPGLVFEPIHRVLFELQKDLVSALGEALGTSFRYEPSTGTEEMVRRVKTQPGPEQVVGFIDANGAGVGIFGKPSSNLPVGTLQAFLDVWLKSGGADRIDYVHGEEIVAKLGSQPGNMGIYLPAMAKTDLFKTVIMDGALPRKTFSMGEAKEKRFYVECRHIA